MLQCGFDKAHSAAEFFELGAELVGIVAGVIGERVAPSLELGAGLLQILQCVLGSNHAVILLPIVVHSSEQCSYLRDHYVFQRFKLFPQCLP